AGSAGVGRAVRPEVAPDGGEGDLLPPAPGIAVFEARGLRGGGRLEDAGAGGGREGGAGGRGARAGEARRRAGGAPTQAGGGPAGAQRKVGKGRGGYGACLPGVAYLWLALQPPAVPDRGPLTHSVPTAFDPGARALVRLALAAAGVRPAIEAEPALIDARL